jgi:predicted enzyme related to lactoylglutathione lyase
MPVQESRVPTDQKINYLELPARDLDAVQSFYEGAFAWSFTDYGPEYRAFNDGTIDGGFYKSEASSSTANGAALIVLFAEDLERTRDTMVEHGGTIVKEIFSFPGGRRFHFADPNGNELAVWSDK